MSGEWLALGGGLEVKGATAEEAAHLLAESHDAPLSLGRILVIPLEHVQYFEVSCYRVPA